MIWWAVCKFPSIYPLSLHIQNPTVLLQIAQGSITQFLCKKDATLLSDRSGLTFFNAIQRTKKLWGEGGKKKKKILPLWQLKTLVSLGIHHAPHSHSLLHLHAELSAELEKEPGRERRNTKVVSNKVAFWASYTVKNELIYFARTLELEVSKMLCSAWKRILKRGRLRRSTKMYELNKMISSNSEIKDWKSKYTKEDSSDRSCRS